MAMDHGECKKKKKKKIPKEIVSNKILVLTSDKLAFSEMHWRHGGSAVVSLVGCVSCTADVSRGICRVIQTFYLSTELQKLLFICERNWKVLSGRCSQDVNDDSKSVSQRSSLEINFVFGFFFFFYNMFSLFQQLLHFPTSISQILEWLYNILVS